MNPGNRKVKKPRHGGNPILPSAPGHPAAGCTCTCTWCGDEAIDPVQIPVSYAPHLVLATYANSGSAGSTPSPSVRIKQAVDDQTFNHLAARANQHVCALPLHYKPGKFVYSDDTFCSFECAVAYASDHPDRHLYMQAMVFLRQAHFMRTHQSKPYTSLTRTAKPRVPVAQATPNKV